MSIHGDVQFISQLKYKTHVAVIEKFIFMSSILNAVAQFIIILKKQSVLVAFSCDYSFIPSMLTICARQIVIYD